MGDLATMLSTLNLSGVNTLLLAAFIYILWQFIKQYDKRLALVEKSSGKHGRSIAWIKGHIDEVEPKEEVDDE